MSGDAPLFTCQSCGAEIPPNLLACPGCQRLLHAARLTSLAEEASAAQQAGDISGRLPPGGPHSNSCRRAQISLRSSRRKSKTLDGNSIVLAISRRPRALPAAGRRRERPWPGWAFWGCCSGSSKLVWLFVLTKGQLLLLGLTKASTFLSMFLFFAVYWAAWGWPFALGLAVSIYIHEMGHVDALRRYGFKATAPMFIPGVGAFVRLQQHPTNPSEDARIGLAGPLWGLGAALACYLMFLATGAKVWAAIAHMGALINILNLIPIASLDGGRGFRALVAKPIHADNRGLRLRLVSHARGADCRRRPGRALPVLHQAQGCGSRSDGVRFVPPADCIAFGAGRSLRFALTSIGYRIGPPPCWPIARSIAAIRRMVSSSATTIFW